MTPFLRHGREQMSGCPTRPTCPTCPTWTLDFELHFQKIYKIFLKLLAMISLPCYVSCIGSLFNRADCSLKPVFFQQISL